MRIAKAAHDRLILQQAELSGADEAPLASRVKEALIQAAEVRNIKSKAQQAADAQEALYHQLRFAAGVASHEPLSIALGPSTLLADSDTEDREDLTFPEPDAMTIITRFGELENELKLVRTSSRCVHSCSFDRYECHHDLDTKECCSGRHKCSQNMQLQLLHILHSPPHCRLKLKSESSELG